MMLKLDENNFGRIQEKAFVCDENLFVEKRWSLCVTNIRKTFFLFV